MKTIVMVGGQNINTITELDFVDIINIGPTDFIKIIDNDTENMILINPKEISYVIDRA